MRKKIILSALVGLACLSCTTKTQNEDWVANAEEIACQQLESMAENWMDRESSHVLSGYLTSWNSSRVSWKEIARPSRILSACR